MRRIDPAIALDVAIDLFGTGKHGYQGGDIKVGRKATQFPPEIPNIQQEELCAIVEAAGIELNSKDNTQILVALKKMFLSGSFDQTSSTQEWRDLIWNNLGASFLRYFNTQFLTSGTAPNFTLRSNTKNLFNQRFRLKFHTAGVGNDAINIDDLGSKKIKQYDATGAKIPAMIIANQLADIEYDGNDFLILNPLPISNSPAGSIIYVAQNTAPTGYLKANGAAISRTAYATLFLAIGTTFGAGDGSNTFNLPDLRAEFIRGWDDGRGIDASRLFGSAQAATAIRVLIDNYLNYPIGTYAVGMRNVDESLRGSGNQNRTIGSDNNFYTNPATINLGSDDNQAFTVRPRNIALLACIKY